MALVSGPVYAVGNLHNPVFLGDEYMGYADWRDFKELSVSDNGTHLIIGLEWYGYLEGDEPYWYRNVYVSLDLDNNRYTGLFNGILSNPMCGADALIFLAFSSGNGHGLRISFYNDAGSLVSQEWHDEWVVSLNNSYALLALPLDSLGLSAGDSISVTASNIYSGSHDILGNSTTFTVPSVPITIDGDDSDWSVQPALGDGVIDEYSLPLQAANLTEVYFAANESHILAAFKTNGIFNISEISSYFNEWSITYVLWMDFNNDGYWDSGFYVIISNFESPIHYPDISLMTFPDRRYFRLVNGVNVSGLESGFVEVAVDLDVLGLGSNIAGSSITLLNVGSRLVLGDSVDIGSRAHYTVGSGGYASIPVRMLKAFVEPGMEEFEIGGLKLGFETLGYNNVYVWEYSVEPTGNASLGNEPASHYYVIWFSYNAYVKWPISLELTVNGTEYYALFFYDKGAGTYKLVKNQVYRKYRGCIEASLGQDEFNAGDEPVVVAMPSPPPSSVGGVLSEDTGQGLGGLVRSVLAFLVPVLLAIIYISYRK